MTLYVLLSTSIWQENVTLSPHYNARDEREILLKHGSIIENKCSMAKSDSLPNIWGISKICKHKQKARHLIGQDAIT
jgi:hypothetical protein